MRLFFDPCTAHWYCKGLVSSATFDFTYYIISKRMHIDEKVQQRWQPCKLPAENGLSTHSVLFGGDHNLLIFGGHPQNDQS